MLEILYRKYYKELYLYIYSLCREKSQTEDVLQETFLKAFTALKDSHTNMRAWLYLVARNICYNSIKKEKRMAATEAIEERTAVQESPLTRIVENEEKSRLWELLLRLPSPRREILVLQYFNGFSQREIAAMLQLTPENVRVQAYRARRQLRELLDREEAK